MNQENPYAAPKANVHLPDAVGGALELLPEPRSVSIGASVDWIKEGWQLIKPSLGTWVLIALVYIIIQIVLSFIPAVGDIASTLLNTVFTGGLMMGLAAVYRGQPMTFNYLFEGFKAKTGPLVGLGAIYLGIMFVVVLIFAGAFYALNSNMDSADMANFMSGGNIVLMIIAFLVFLAVMMMLWFTVPLVALNDVPVFESLSRSFKACLRNPLPLFVYMLLLTLIFIISLIPVGLGLLIALPLFYGSSFASYRQIFLR